MLANTIIKAALRKLVVIPSGGTPTANQYADGLEVLNDILASWSANASLVYQDSLEEIVIASGTQSFTLGATGDYVTTKPTEVIKASLKDVNSVEYGLKTAFVNEYTAFGDKTVVGTPRWLYFRNTHPNSTFYFNLTTEQSFTLILTSMKELTQFADGTTDLDIPAYYEKAFKDNLTIELAPEMGAAKRVTPLMIQRAEESKSMVIGKGTRIIPSTTELSRPSGYNINGDTY